MKITPPLSWLASCLLVSALAVAASLVPVSAAPSLGLPVCIVSEKAGPGAFPLVRGLSAAPIFLDRADYPGVIRAAHDLRDDVERVTGVKPELATGRPPAGEAVVIAGTLGKSPLIDNLAICGKIKALSISGKWESFVIATVANPLPGVNQALVIAGSDKRGTIYGLYEVSAQIGVSPWYWWADVPVRHKYALFVRGGRYVEGPPAVKYRGIFINDEAPAMSGWTQEKFGGFNSKMYAHLFELLLRLKANYLWPAMWGHKFDVDDPDNPKLADEYGIVMGTSHQEPMMRSDQEINDDIKSRGPYDYAQNRDAIYRFWQGGVDRVKDDENIYTLGMRGTGDTAINARPDQIIPLLEKVVADQRAILAREVNPDVTRVPQMWCLYKEVQGYYDQGLRVPDDVTLLWSDDNFGNLRRVPTPRERRRRGGAGIYYHFDYVGDPRDYKWLNTVPIEKVWEQMHNALAYDARRIWVVNVGDLKPMEFPISFFMDYAWDPQRWPKDRLGAFTRLWAQQQFGPQFAPQIADVLEKYTKYNGRRKPEEMDSEPYSLTDYREADRVSAEWQALGDEAQGLYDRMPADEKDAFYQLVLYPARASGVVTRLYIAAARNHLYARQGCASANTLADRTEALFREDARLAAYYNHTMSRGKWDHMMDQSHIGYTSWNDPPRNNMPRLTRLDVPAAPGLGVAVEGSESAWPAAGTGKAALPPFDPHGPQSQYIEVFDRGRAPFTYTATPSAPWVRVSALAGTVGGADRRIEVSIDWARVPAGSSRDAMVTVSGAGGATVVRVRADHPPEPSDPSPGAFVESQGYVAMEAAHYTGKTDTPAAHWDVIPNYGRTLSSMSIFPVTAPSMTPPAAPRLQYRMYLTGAGRASVRAVLAPSLNFVAGRGLRYAVSLDDGPPRVVDVYAHETHGDWQRSVIDNCRVATTALMVDRPGYHTLNIWMVDPGVVLQKLVVDLGGLRPSYLGPPESGRLGGSRSARR
ncbi:MAG: glycosyl hydrolase 115 family protein [Armatimonadetes bacterium]|nr:glycosyl hydrolase 115 family protein [Armatimonadota bacterium]